MSLTSRMWNSMYRGHPSWDLGTPDPVLAHVLDERDVRGPGRAIDLGCGTGDNAIELARRGFDVIGIDLSVRALSIAREKAAEHGVTVDLRVGNVTALDGIEGPFAVIVDRGLLMSLPGERARRAYVATLRRLAPVGGNVFEFQWVLCRAPRPLSSSWILARTKIAVLAPGEIEKRLGDNYAIEILSQSVSPVDDRFLRRLGLKSIAKTYWWLTRLAD